VWLGLARGVVLAIVTAWTRFPVCCMVMLAVTPWNDLFQPRYWVKRATLDNFEFVIFRQSPFVKVFWRWLGNSLIVSAATMAAVLVVAWLGSVARGRIRFGLGRLISGMTLFTYLTPASFLSIPVFKTMGDYNLLDTYWSPILAMITFASPYAL
jgi:multiple sugar transport system permease protein